MDAHTRADLGRLEERLRTIENQARDIPSRIGRNRGDYDYIRIGGGNNVSPAGFVGVKRIVTTLTEIGTQYDPATNPATIDGVGWGWHYRLQIWVLILNDATCGLTHDAVAEAIVKCPALPAVLPGPTAGAPTFYLTLYQPITL